MAPKVCIKLQMKERVRQEKTERAPAFQGNDGSASYRHIQKLSLFMHRYIYAFLFEIHSYIALLTYRPSAAREG